MPCNVCVQKLASNRVTLDKTYRQIVGQPTMTSTSRFEAGLLDQHPAKTPDLLRQYALPHPTACVSNPRRTLLADCLRHLRWNSRRGGARSCRIRKYVWVRNRQIIYRSKRILELRLRLGWKTNQNICAQHQVGNLGMCRLDSLVQQRSIITSLHSFQNYRIGALH